LPSNGTCTTKRLQSLKDYSAAETLLDPDGVLNWLAVGYN
jgi:hypothetical protein